MSPLQVRHREWPCGLLWIEESSPSESFRCDVERAADSIVRAVLISAVILRNGSSSAF
jgi:hypothetical protein